MANEDRIAAPFLAHIGKKINSEVESKIGLTISQYDFAVPYFVVEDGKMIKRYENERGEQLHFSDQNLIQSFLVVENMQGVSGRWKADCYGASFLPDISYVIMGFKGCEPSVLWRSMALFKPDALFATCGLNEAGTEVKLSGKIQGNVSIEMDAMTITNKYFKEQLAKVQRQQLRVNAMEFRFKLLIENVCDLCLTYP